MPDPIPALLPTAVIGSYSLPRWLEQPREDHKSGALGDAELDEAHDNAVKAWLKDQEMAGVDVITDDGLRRETMICFFHPDCGLKFTRRAVAYAKRRAMTAGAALARAELGRG
ncbi:MAG: hypothetical protein HYU42_09540 [Candidatus Rokubacteria bacterium]|nr:hypothetical protein [Candidatus Rokubacteria bacterium]MBI3105524.1 hypothetical protein [Candidatus Rokubacteria bacterium]